MFLHSFVQRHVSAVVMSHLQVDHFFLSKVNNTISNAIVIVNNKITIQLALLLLLLTIAITIALLIVWFTLLKKSDQPDDGS